MYKRQILLEALKAGAIDLYPEYTGTIAREILKSEDRLDLAALNEKLKPLGLAASLRRMPSAWASARSPTW